MTETPASLVDRAEEAGVSVVWTTAVRRADYRAGVIRVNLRMHESAQVVALAHELGHAHYGHVGDSDLHERQANAYAARLLISADEYARAERITGPHAGAIARELGVTTALVEAWRKTHQG